MGLKDKLTNIKEVIIEEVNETVELSTLNAEEIAERYGYEKLLAVVTNRIEEKREDYQDALKNAKKRELLRQIAELEGKEYEDDEENEEVDSIYISFGINLYDEGKKFTIKATQFGKKQEFDVRAVRAMLSKINLEVDIIDERDEKTIIITEKQANKTQSFVNDNGESVKNHIDHCAEVAKEFGKSAGEVAKKKIRQLSEWADKNL